MSKDQASSRNGANDRPSPDAVDLSRPSLQYFFRTRVRFRLPRLLGS